MVGTKAMVSRLPRAREIQLRSGASPRITCGCAAFLAADFVLSVMVQVNR
jgi:hypothetical protein